MVNLFPEQPEITVPDAKPSAAESEAVSVLSSGVRAGDTSALSSACLGDRSVEAASQQSRALSQHPGLKPDSLSVPEEGPVLSSSVQRHEAQVFFAQTVSPKRALRERMGAPEEIPLVSASAIARVAASKAPCVWDPG